MLVQVAAHQLLLARAAVEKLLPGLQLARHLARRRQRRVTGRTRSEPTRQHALLALVEPAQPVGHASERVVALVGVELAQARARLRAVERKVEAVRKHLDVGQRVGSLERQAAVQHAGRQIVLGRGRALVEHRIEALAAPLRGQLRVDEQSRRRRLAEPRRVVHRRLGDAANDAFPRAELELARGVIATVADHAAAVENGPHVVAVRHAARCGDRCSIEAGDVSSPVTLVQRVLGQCRATGDAGDDEGKGRAAHVATRSEAAGMLLDAS